MRPLLLWECFLLSQKFWTLSPGKIHVRVILLRKITQLWEVCRAPETQQWTRLGSVVPRLRNGLSWVKRVFLGCSGDPLQSPPAKKLFDVGTGTSPRGISEL